MTKPQRSRRTQCGSPFINTLCAPVRCATRGVWLLRQHLDTAVRDTRVVQPPLAIRTEAAPEKCDIDVKLLLRRSY